MILTRNLFDFTTQFIHFYFELPGADFHLISHDCSEFADVCSYIHVALKQSGNCGEINLFLYPITSI